MARPIKRTVDYFSHDADASEGRTLSILYNHFGHDGISAWWQLLERVSKTENHVISIRNSEEKEWLASKLRFPPDKMMVILGKMAELEAIDSCLFTAGLIWSQNLVARLSDVYKNRKQEAPTKPPLPTLYMPLENSKISNNPINNTTNPITTPDNPITIQEMQQSKVKESKGKVTLQDGKPSSFFEFNEIISKNGCNKVGVLVNAFKAWHSKAPPEDFKDCGNRIAAMLKQCNQDYGFLLKQIYVSGTNSIAGSHLNYIQGILRREKSDGENRQNPANKSAGAIARITGS